MGSSGLARPGHAGYHSHRGSSPLSENDLARRLEALEGRGYRAYRELRGQHPLGDLDLFVDRVQGDPFAAPSRLRVRIPMPRAGLPEALFQGRVRRVALADFLARRARDALATSGEGGGPSGAIHVDAGGQEVLERSCVVIDPGFVELRLEAGLPARGRRIQGRAAAKLLTRTIPEGARRALLWEQQDALAAHAFVHCVENQEHVRSRLAALGLVAFVADGARLPRESGASDRPLADGVVPFRSPPELSVRIPVPNPPPFGAGAELVGMGIPRGVTLVVGGGYHGKSTLLQALGRCVHPHVPGDGREHVVADAGLVQVRAEDGRRVERVDIHAFVAALPGGRDTHAFSSDDASGSTSQASAIVEAIEAGATGLLLDEDTSATNFMLRDARMQALVAARDEPITPFVDRVREIHERFGVSTVLVMGGSGDYFDVADRVIAMRGFHAIDVTREAQAVARRLPTPRVREVVEPLVAPAPRIPDAASIDASRGRHDVKIDAPPGTRFATGASASTCEASRSSPVAARRVPWPGRSTSPPGASCRATRASPRSSTASTPCSIARVSTRSTPEDGTGGAGRHPGDLARPRRFEIAAALDRLRGMRMRAPAPYPVPVTPGAATAPNRTQEIPHE